MYCFRTQISLRLRFITRLNKRTLHMHAILTTFGVNLRYYGTYSKRNSLISYYHKSVTSIRYNQRNKKRNEGGTEVPKFLNYLALTEL